MLEGRPNIVDAMKNGEVQLVFNTTEGRQSLKDCFSLRRTALMMKIPYYTTAAGALAAAQAITADGRAGGAPAAELQPGVVSALTAITTCKGRLAHLKETLPTLCAAAGLDVVLVDYDCPEGAGAWAEAAHPDVRVVKVRDRPLFNLSEARNLGAAAADTDWLVFLDADVGVTADFAREVEARLKPQTYFLPDPRPAGLWGASSSHAPISTPSAATTKRSRVGGPRTSTSSSG